MKVLVTKGLVTKSTAIRKITSKAMILFLTSAFLSFFLKMTAGQFLSLYESYNFSSCTIHMLGLSHRQTTSPSATTRLPLLVLQLGQLG
jgi:hypothetical protein